jgi:hypothetical protein
VRSRGSRMSRRPWSYSQCQTAQCCSFPRRVAAPGLWSSSHLLSLLSAGEPGGLQRQRRSRQQQTRRVPPRNGGVDGAPTDALFLSVAPATRDHPVPGRPGPLSALHRGDFRMRTHEVGSRQWNRSRSDCPRQAVMTWRSGSGPPVVAVRAAAWDATPRSAYRTVSGRRPSMSEDENLYTINSLRSQYRSCIVVILFRTFSRRDKAEGDAAAPLAAGTAQTVLTLADECPQCSGRSGGSRAENIPPTAKDSRPCHA